MPDMALNSTVQLILSQSNVAVVDINSHVQCL